MGVEPLGPRENLQVNDPNITQNSPKSLKTDCCYARNTTRPEARFQEPGQVCCSRRWADGKSLALVCGDMEHRRRARTIAGVRVFQRAGRVENARTGETHCKRAGLFWFTISPLFTDPAEGSAVPLLQPAGVGLEPGARFERTQLIDSNTPQKRQNRSFRRLEVRGGYTARQQESKLFWRRGVCEVRLTGPLTACRFAYGWRLPAKARVYIEARHWRSSCVARALASTRRI